MKVFSDRHHEGLFESLCFLFEDRLGGELFYPLGLEWWNQGFWEVFPHEATAKQYLSLDQLYKPIDGTPPLNQILEVENGIYSIESPNNHRPIKGISLEKFKETKFDIIIASIPQHVEKFIKLRDLYQPQAKLIFQVGNSWAFDNSFPVKNILASAIIPRIDGFNQVTYHQQFPLDLYSYEPPKRTKRIYSFINCLGVVDIYKEDWELFLELEKLLPGFQFESFGGQTRGGAVAPQSEVARLTKEADFIYHAKRSGDGYSYGMHTAAACGKPIITRASDYKGKLAESLIEDGVSTINVDNKSPQEVANLIQTTYMTSKLKEMSEQVYKKFKENVDFDIEELFIRDFLSKLL